MVDLNSNLKDLLMREAHLRLYRERLEPLWEKREAALREIETAPPFFMPVFSSAKRADHEQRLAAAREAASYLRNGMEVIDRIEPYLKNLIEQQIEETLPDIDPAYAKVLAAREQKPSWDAGLERYAEKIGAFLEVVYQSRGHAASLAAGPLAKRMQAAAKAARDEALATNHIAAEQVKMYLDGGINPRPLPRLPDADLAAEVLRIASLPQAEVHERFSAFIDQTEQFRTNGIAALRAEAEAINKLQLAKIHALLLNTWVRLRAELAPEIFYGDTEHVVNETAEMVYAKAS